MKSPYIPKDDANKDSWLSNFAGKLPTYATKYGITATEVTDMTKGYDWFHYWLDYKNKYQEYLKKLTDFKNQIRDGVPAGAVAAVVPTPPVVATLPTAVAPDVFGRAASIAARIKGFQSYTQADGNDLGIIGAENTVDLITIKPAITLRLKAGHPEVVWTRKSMSGIEIYVCRDGSNIYSFLAVDSNPNYIDNAPLPAQGETQLWKYKAIYRLKDEQVGQWSDEVSITVVGN